jgi:hypothetical protein
MPNGREHLKYEDFGNHRYASHRGTSDCEYGCGCWMGPARSGSKHAGVAPGGKCPNNYTKELPLDFGKPLSNEQILFDFVNSRIQQLELKVIKLQKSDLLVQKAKKSSKIDLLKRLDEQMAENNKLKNQVNRIKQKLQTIIDVDY